jgi:hypothetical protein
MVYGPQKPISLGIILPEHLGDALIPFSKKMQEAVSLLEDKAPYARCVAMQLAIQATTELVKAIPQYRVAGFEKPFSKLEKSLRALLDGTEVAEFASLRKPKTESLQTQMFKTNCAVAMALFMHNGAKRMDAARKVRAVYPALDLKAETIADWRDKLIGNSDDLMANWYKEHIGFAIELRLTDQQMTELRRATVDLNGVELKRQANRVSKTPNQN